MKLRDTVKKSILSLVFCVVSYLADGQTTYSGVFRTPSNNTTFHHFTLDSDGFAAVYINQIGDGDILTLSSGIQEANKNNRFVVRNNGSIHIGKQVGTYDFQIKRSGAEGNVVLLLESDDDNSVESSNPMIKMLQDGGTIGTNIGFSESQFGSNNFGIGMRYSNQDKNNAFIINSQSGFVGIGTKSPDSELTVKGKIHTNEVKVDLNGALMPDYVFLENYKLKPLKEVEDYITINGHLESIPSAQQVEKEGLNMKAMHLKMLEKIEELTLYIIEQNKINKKQQQELIDLKKQLQLITE